ncbi:YihY/virulence factor BrkB family protein [Steroidobacter cummioxidans]|uniref:YihY/virulence factor BrkB family protein n=1 Tax=Steroidobacter cummioxidans TaxID=1803913 RepID=UPI0012902F91|nr:YihY/virulence factor BrkB family protein [Steroidobacter cummioxidans]
MARQAHADVGMENLREHRGRAAERPREIPARGWWDIARRVQKELTADNVSIIAAGLAMYALLAAFPALAAVVSIYGLFASPADIANHIQQVAPVLPQQAQMILQQRLTILSQHPQSTLSAGILIGIALALWSSRQGMVALMTATNVAYNQREHRGFFKQLFVSLAFTVGGIMGFLVVLLLGIAVPLVLSLVPLGAATQGVLLVARWLLLFAAAVLGLAIVYRFAPDRREAQWRWITPGSLIAATLWLAASVLFAVYAQNWGRYDQTYGALGGVVILLMWFYLTGYVIILGAEINSEMERQTKKDTTEGEPKPMGRRGAYSADTVGPSAGELKNQ